MKVWRPNLDDCWLWEGAVNPDGYGTFRAGERFFNSHRFVMMLALGRELERGEVLDHLCRVKQCCNPLHLEVVSVSVNTKRGYDADPGLTW
jgi:hypothetical protein